MTEDEIRRLYAVAMAYDNRRLSEANITAWWEQAERNRWTFDEAREAVHQHHCESADFLMPAHITAIIRARRRQPAPVAEVKAIAREPLSNPASVSSIIGKIRQELGWTPRNPSEAPLEIECPHCHAQPKRRCTRFATRGKQRGQYVPIADFHESRKELAAKAGQS